eukprot:CAMPEP_0194108436 /NCGR_PEP_ID=MMETSP0150-20130528/8127_1 /TAXON_ID=122233 /ORGANISM="Chaetoceros debilis, Strain MM31A-1" /LENGTH=288 /DNA_ID=CAMNT_0038797133 /DNA_START=162 /DNA_END=1028 /DNA_ORIENTATION=+
MVALVGSTSAFTIGSQSASAGRATTSTPTPTQLPMALDLVTGLRTEWISASICTNQIPSDALSVLQLGTEDGRVVNFVPKSIEEILTSSAEADGELSMSCKRQLKQQRELRGTGAVVRYLDQPCDDLREMKDASVDCVISLQAAQRMAENGQNWKNSIKEAARVLKPDGSFIFVEQTEIEGEKYIEVISSVADGVVKTNEETGEEELETYPTFELVGYDDVDLVIVPHIAGVVKKTKFAGLTETEIKNKSANDEKERIADLSISAFERGIKKRRKKKKKKGMQAEEEA